MAPLAPLQKMGLRALLLLSSAVVALSIGVASFLETKTDIDRVKLFDANPDIIRAFANTAISLTISTTNGDIPNLVSREGAAAWVANHVAPFYPATKIGMVLVGNEILMSGDNNLIYKLVPAMRSLHNALIAAGFRQIRVSTPHYLGILANSEQPSTARFRYGWQKSVLIPMLNFHRATKSPFVVNPYPYFNYNPQTLNYANFRRNSGIFDKYTKIRYTNMLDAQLDAIYSAMKRIGYGDVQIVIGETGWPTQAEPGQVGVSPDYAASYVNGLINKVSSGRGTPLMPGRKFETYIFALFNENLKPGPIAERNWGLFRPDFTPMYNARIMKGQVQVVGRRGGMRRGGRRGSWCVPRAGVSPAVLQNNINYACSNGVDCHAIQAGGACFAPNNLQAHAAYAMNAYYRTHGQQPSTCNFAGTGFVTPRNPSRGLCRF
ncbi:glucan endo-1,3-beta-glucosidase-like [Carex rostrata]